jgi:hypothetical protein
MSAVELLCCLVGLNTYELKRKESFFLETELFIRICDELKEFFKVQHIDYFFSLKGNTETENSTMEENIIRFVINDILSTEEYSLSGVACYTYMPEDVIYEVAIGKNIHPSLFLSRKIIELHRSVRPALYREIIKKIIEKYYIAIEKI